MWQGSYRMPEQLQNGSTIDTFLSKETICLFNTYIKFYDFIENVLKKDNCR